MRGRWFPAGLKTDREITLRTWLRKSNAEGWSHDMSTIKRGKNHLQLIKYVHSLSPSFRLNWGSSVQVKILLKFLLSSCRLWLKDEGWLFNQCQWLTWNFKSILTWTQHRGFFYWLRGTWVKKTLSKKPNFWQTDDVSRNPSWLQLVENDTPDEISTLGFLKNWN